MAQMRVQATATWSTSILRCTVALLMVGLLGACSNDNPAPDPTDTDSAARAAGDLAAGVAKKDLTGLTFVGATGAEVNDRFQPLVRGMGPIKPQVRVGSVDAQGNAATAVLSYRWEFPGVPQPWTYDATVQLTREAGVWKSNWQPTVVSPALDESHRLTQRRRDPQRGELVGRNGDTLVTLRPVVRIGIDKANVGADRVQSSARRLARLVDIDADAYVKKVAAAGPDAFVEAITYRATAKQRPDNDDVFAIKGALPVEAEQMLAPNRDFARALIGTVGEATKEIVEASGGAVVAGDQVGLSGLQKRYDQQLRGTPGVQVGLVAAAAAGASPSATPSPTASATPAPATVLFETAPTAGKPLTLTLDRALQGLAEKVLAKTKPASALVAVQPSTGAVLAAANGPGANGQALATTGQMAPGSTFKVITSLALLRSGLEPGSAVRCPASITVDGRKFTNYSDYPSSARGTIDLQTAVAQSCNTAFIGQRGRIDGDDLNAAAGSLGVGTDYDVGFPAYFGSVPEASGTGEAAAMIGQGKVLASPLVMAGVVASVSAGKTVVPHLVEGTEADPQGEPLARAEADQLRQMLRAVVTDGSGRVLAGAEPPAVIAKTGTAEYGSDEPLKTHAWMIAAQEDLAVAVFVRDGQSGSRTAGPLLRAFLDDAQ